jgi:hypothetical protein
MRQSRLSQFNEIKSSLDARAEAFIDECFPVGRPSTFYMIDVNYMKHKEGYNIAECPVTKITYSWNLPWFKVRPSDEQVRIAAVKLHSMMKNENVFLHTENDNASFAVPLPRMDDFLNRCSLPCSFDRQKLEPELARLIEVYVCKEGQFKCKQCGAATDNAKKYVGTIFARQYPGMRAQFDFCSHECASHCQMGHEG